MSLHFILDGYNVIKQSDFLVQNPLKDARKGLLKFIKDKRPCGSSKNKVIVVFDGKSNFCASAELDALERKENIEVIFTCNESADSRIKRMVNESQNARSIVVVSDDKEIQFFVRSCGATTLGVAQFVSRVKSIEKPLRGLAKIELSYQQVAQINQELRKIWLEK
jgi:predicted RNA-binding protein with PIN domain